MGYRPDIDGLRAVAVLLVVLFHAGASALSGGFVGVDVFFVISGFLITGIVDREIQNQRFTLAAFYRRRILRIMPALFATAWATTAVAAAILLPSDFAAFGKSLIAVTLSVANVYFWRANGGYFGENAQEVPLLHTWSLAVEEQYYLVWPVALAFLSRRLSRRALVVLVSLVALASLVLAEWSHEFTIGAGYYLLPTRVFELTTGSLVALTWNGLPRIRPLANSLLSMGGLLSILWSAIGLSEGDRFPGINALYPTVGTAMLIVSGRDTATLLTRVLSLRPLVFVGLISYSLYLWHWPVVVFVRYAGLDPTLLLSSAIVTVSILLAWLSWKYVETPFRQPGALTFGQVFSRRFAVPALLTVATGAAIWVAAGFPARFSPEIAAMDAALSSRPDVIRGHCHSSARDADEPPSPDCRFGTRGTARHTAFLFGDSYANHFTGFLGVLAEQAHVSVLDYTMDACQPVAGIRWGRSPFFGDSCQARNALAIEYLNSHPVDYVVLAGRWPSGHSGTAVARGQPEVWDGNARVADWQSYQSLFVQGLDRTFAAITSAGAVPVVIKSGVPTRRSPKCPVVKAYLVPWLECRARQDELPFSDQLVDDALRALGSKYPGVLVIDPKRAMCQNGMCESTIGGVPLYRDAVHLNHEGSRALGAEYARLHGNPFMSAPVR